MSSEVFIYEAIDIEPPVSEAELAPKLDSGEYRKVTWDDPRMGEGYFVRVSDHGSIGIAVVPAYLDSGELVNQGLAIQANPVAEDHFDMTVDADIRKIVADFGIAPSGIRRVFNNALHIEKDGGQEMIVVRDNGPVRVKS